MAYYPPTILGFSFGKIVAQRVLRRVYDGGKIEEFRQPLVVSYGMGVDSTSMLIGFRDIGVKPDLILFADTGGEKPETYAYLPIMQAWLKKAGFPPVIIVRYQPKNFKNWPPYKSLEENCLTNGTLPSLAFGFKSCSLKWKVAPQEKYLKTWELAQKTWQAGAKVVKAIGYDCSPADARRRNHVGDQNDPLYDYIYPLQDWKWDRDECIRQIDDAKLPIPPKSSCFFCPAMKQHEVSALNADMLRRIVRMEARAAPRLTTTEGLWRKTTKTKPGRMTDYIRSEGLLPAEEVDRIIAEVPQEIVDFQVGYAAAKAEGKEAEFVASNAKKDYRPSA